MPNVIQPNNPATVEVKDGWFGVKLRIRCGACNRTTRWRSAEKFPRHVADLVKHMNGSPRCVSVSEFATKEEAMQEVERRIAEDTEG